MRLWEMVKGRRMFEGAGHAQQSEGAEQPVATADAVDVLIFAASDDEAEAARINDASYRARKLMIVS